MNYNNKYVTDTEVNTDCNVHNDTRSWEKTLHSNL